MTQQGNNIAEGNKIIAEFMGATWTKDDFGVYGYRFETYPTQWASRWWDARALQYHSSWDWLMPVVEKISGIAEEAYDNDVILYKRCGEVLSSHVCVSIETLRSRIIQFIQWYNQR